MSQTATTVIHLLYSGASGASTVAVNLAVRLAGRLSQQAVLYGVPAPRETYGRALDEQGVAWEYVPKRPGAQPAAYVRTARRLAARAQGEGVVIVHGLRLFPVLAALKLHFPRTATVGYVHGPTEELRGPGVWRALGSVWVADHLICVTEELRDIVSRLPFGARAARSAVVVPNGVDTSFWRPDSARRPPGPHELRLCFAGTLTHRKRAELALEAVASLLRQGLAAHLDICGDGPERTRLEALAGAMGLREAVAFRGLLSPAVLRDVLTAGHVLIHPSRSEGLSLAVLEALACGCPVVLGAEARAGALAAGFGPDSGVSIAGEASAAGLVATVRNFVDRPDVWARQAENARRTVLASFSLDGQAERFLAALQGWWPAVARQL